MISIRAMQAGDWGRMSSALGTAPFKFRMALERASRQEAHFYRKKVVEGFREQAPGGQPFKPLSPLTLAFRREAGKNSTKALIVDGDLRNSITMVEKKTFLGPEIFVGVLRQTRGKKSGKKMVNIAEVHEFGSKPIVIPVTDAMRAFFFSVLNRQGVEPEPGDGGFARGYLVVKIPARPFMRPVLDKYFKGPAAALRYQTRVSVALAGLKWPPPPGLGGGQVDMFKGAVGASVTTGLAGKMTRNPLSGRFMKK